MRLILLTLFVTFLAAAQDKPIFSTTTHLVVETVAVTDKEGHPVTGLSAKDFTVLEDGKPQTLAFAEYQTLTDASPMTALTANVAPVSRMRRTHIQPEKPGDVRYRDRRLLAMYFDLSAMPPQDQARAIAAAQRFIRTRMTASDLVAIMTYSGGAVEVLDDFTADRAKLLETLQTLLVGEEIDYTITKDADAAFGQNDGEFNLFNTDRQLSALQTAAATLGVLSEKKSLLYFASGLRLNGVNNQAQLHATENAAIRAGVTFWPIDARGLVAFAPLGDATQPSPGGIGIYNGETAAANTRGFYASQDTLYALAADTGGKALLDDNDLAQGIVNAQKAVSSYYVLGYYTSNAARDGKLRRIKISVNNQAALTLDYRQTYFAEKEFGKFTSVDKERQLEEALMAGDPITELTLALEVNYFQLNRAEYYVPIAVKIPGSELARAKKGGAERTSIDFVGEIKENGTTVANLRDKVDLKLSDETAAELSKRPITYDGGFTLLPGHYVLKFLARDAETGRIGTFIHPFVIPNLAKEQRYQPISSVVLSSQSVDMQNAIFNAKDKLHAQDLNPLVHDGRKLIPSVTRVFSRSRDMYVFVQAYGNHQPTAAIASFYRDGRKVWESPPVTGDARSVRMQFSLEHLPAGEYTCQLTVLNPADQKAAFWQGQVMVIP